MDRSSIYYAADTGPLATVLRLPLADLVDDLEDAGWSREHITLFLKSARGEFSALEDAIRRRLRILPNPLVEAAEELEKRLKAGGG